MSEDITGDLDLLGDWLDAKGYTEEAGLCTRAMDEINKLRAALKLFADLEPEDIDCDENGVAIINLDDLRAAKAALKETGDE